MSWIKSSIIVLFSTLMTLEISSFILTKSKLFIVNNTPKLYQSIDHDVQDIVYGRTERDLWGAWHKPNGTYQHVKGCFNVKMSFNEVGARDETFTTLSDNTLILLGDSFAEGYGVSYEDTSQFIIEQNLNRQVANFGASGDFGPLQELIIYNEFKYLPHNGLIVYVLPANDFRDNDAQYWSKRNRSDRTRYRPYFSNGSQPLTPYFFPEAIKRDNFLHQNFGSLKQFIKNNFWSANAIRNVIILMREANLLQLKINLWGYYDASLTQQRNLISAYDAILDSADNKDVLFVLIPDQNDIVRNRDDNIPDRYKSQDWYQGFQKFSERRSQRVSVLDLMDHLPVDTDELFFSCDGHWSPAGNRWAAEVIVAHIDAEGIFMSEYNQ